MEDEAGKFDFTLSSAGHGIDGVKLAQRSSDGLAVITSSSHPDSSLLRFTTREDITNSGSNFHIGTTDGGNGNPGCYVSARSIASGDLVWRRDVCSTALGKGSINSRYALYAPSSSDRISSDKFYTLDIGGTFSTWEDRLGALVSTRSALGEGVHVSDLDDQISPRILAAGPVIAPVYAMKKGGDALTFEVQKNDDLNTTQIISMTAKDMLTHAGVKPSSKNEISVARFINMASSTLSSDFSSVILIAGWVSPSENGQQFVTSLNQMAKLVIDLEGGKTSILSQLRFDISSATKLSPSVNIATTKIDASTIIYFRTNDSNNDVSNIMAINYDQQQLLHFSPDTKQGKLAHMGSLHPKWTLLHSIQLINDIPIDSTKGTDSFTRIKVTGADDRYPITRHTSAVYPLASMKQIHPTDDKDGEETQYDGLVACNGIFISFYHDTYYTFPSPYLTEEENISNNQTGSNIIRAFHASQGGEVAKSLPVNRGSELNAGPVIDAHLLQCTSNYMETLITSSGGTTHLLPIKFSNNDQGQISSVVVLDAWSAQESLGSVNSAIFLDESHSPQMADMTEEELILSLTFAFRLQMQIQNLIDFLTGGIVDNFLSIIGKGTKDEGRSMKKKQYYFGLEKVAVLLSSPLSKVLGMDTGSKGNLIWSIDLNPTAQWHKIVHGASTTRSSVFGQGMHHPHSHELLILSHTSNAVEWYCIDGLRGHIHSKSAVSISSPVVQVLPIHSHGGVGSKCRQSAILLHEDNSVSTVPNSPQSLNEISNMLSSTNGIYVHTVNKKTGTLASLQINLEEDKGMEKSTTEFIGESVFDPELETILSTSYPQRNEVIQSPATIRGDDSLLLKYINPHLCVVVTQATQKYVDLLHKSNKDMDVSDLTQRAFYDALSSSGAAGVGNINSAQKKKPLGVTQANNIDMKDDLDSSSSTENKAIPTLFVNLVDTVSGRILHRVSHSHLLPGSESDYVTTSTPHVPVVISENWIIYSYPDIKSRRTELGVLTLHEGMIEKRGITAFHSPEQQTSFSSLMNAKPIVLSKTFAVPKPVTAIGVTNTRSGIASKNIIFATGVDGGILVLDRRWLDPRRPSGTPKESEKKEGLMQYMPLIPMSPTMIASYFYEVSSASKIVSTAANLESQSLMLGFGGPDIFFTRLAPSRGFDSLPEDFNKILLLALVFGLAFALKLASIKSKENMRKIGWS